MLLSSLTISINRSEFSICNDMLIACFLQDESSGVGFVGQGYIEGGLGINLIEIKMSYSEEEKCVMPHVKEQLI